MNVLSVIHLYCFSVMNFLSAIPLYCFSVMDWNNSPDSAGIYTVASVAGTMIVWILLYGLYWIRRVIHRSCCPHDDMDEHGRKGEHHEMKGEVNQSMDNRSEQSFETSDSEKDLNVTFMQQGKNRHLD